MLIRPISIVLALVTLSMCASPALATISFDPTENEINNYEGQTIKVETGAAASVTKSSAVLNGFLESLGPYVEVYVWFELSNGLATSPKKMKTPGSFSATISGLANYTPYQFRAIAASPLIGGQKELGTYQQFHTLADKPISPIDVSCSMVSNVTPESVVLHGYLSRMESYSAVRVWFNWGTSSGFGNTAGEQILYAPGPFSVRISGLNPKVIYYYRVGAVPAVGGTSIVYSTTDTFTTQGGGEVAVSTMPATGVTSTSVTFTGYLESTGAYSSVNVWFEWGKTSAYGYVTPVQTMNMAGIYNYSLRGLEAGTTYHFRALALPGAATWVTVRGIDYTFTTTALSDIAVSTEAANSVTSNSAILNGLVTSLSSSGTALVWFEYGTDTTYGNQTPQQPLNTPGSFACAVTGLAPGITYYYRAVAFVDGRTANGRYNTFYTAASSDLSISTREASSISPSSASLHAYVNSLGSAPHIRVWFIFGNGPECDRSTSAQSVVSAGTIVAPVSELLADTTYYYQAVAQSPDGNTTYGKQADFKTRAVSTVTVITNPAADISDSSVTLNGDLSSMGNNASVQVWFEYGTTPEFGSSTEVKKLDSPAPFTSIIRVLPGTAYYYRAQAINPAAAGIAVPGAVVSFVTAALPSPPEVSPFASPHDWFVYCQRFISYEIGQLVKSLNKASK